MEFEKSNNIVSDCDACLDIDFYSHYFQRAKLQMSWVSTNRRYIKPDLVMINKFTELKHIDG